VDTFVLRLQHYDLEEFCDNAHRYGVVEKNLHQDGMYILWATSRCYEHDGESKEENNVNRRD
jgi:hypothetical protein